jgi:parallel beta-helix repeat protein
MEERLVLSTYVVTNLNDTGAGTFRQAILDANANAGADTIQFDVAGTIHLGKTALAAITDTVTIDGTTAPGYAGTPAVQIDFNNKAGLQFVSGADGSELLGLSLVHAHGAGLTINGANNMTVTGNYIGVDLDGSTADGNTGSGLVINNATGNTIGGQAAADSNVISANRGDGITVTNAAANSFINNFIGTDATGTFALGNRGNGITLSTGATNNLIGGTDDGGNDPTNNVFVRPLDGNIISGNSGNGVSITNKASGNTLSGNFIGTDITGNVAIGNTRDGVAINNADNNSLIGCTASDNPFIYYNVVSGNGGNGVSVTNSDYTTIQANFFGMGANNDTDVGNGKNGVLVTGNSAHTVFGGPIPLGNVTANNGQNGLMVSGTASDFVAYNTFAGLAAFSTNPNFGNGNDGMLITSTGGNILIRTNVITENGNDGIEIGGNAHGIVVTGNIVGLNTSGMTEMGNVNHGIEVDGNANDIVIGGQSLTFNIIPENVFSGNGNAGVALDGNAHNITVNNSYIGTDVTGKAAVANADSGILIAGHVNNVQIGSTDTTLPTLISGNVGDGITINGGRNVNVIDTFIGTDVTGGSPLGNGGNGIYISNGSNNDIGIVGDPQNIIAFNGGNGVQVASGQRNAIHQNSIYSNGNLGIDLGQGANNNQPAPAVMSVQTPDPWTGTITGTLSAIRNTTYTIEIFQNYGDGPNGQIYLGTVTVKTDIHGQASFHLTATFPSFDPYYFTGTATDPQGNTSEFSGAVPNNWII